MLADWLPQMVQDVHRIPADLISQTASSNWRGWLSRGLYWLFAGEAERAAAILKKGLKAGAEPVRYTLLRPQDGAAPSYMLQRAAQGHACGTDVISLHPLNFPGTICLLQIVHLADRSSAFQPISSQEVIPSQMQDLGTRYDATTANSAMQQAESHGGAGEGNGADREGRDHPDAPICQQPGRRPGKHPAEPAHHHLPAHARPAHVDQRRIRDFTTTSHLEVSASNQVTSQQVCRECRL